MREIRNAKSAALKLLEKLSTERGHQERQAELINTRYDWEFACSWLLRPEAQYKRAIESYKETFCNAANIDHIEFDELECLELLLMKQETVSTAHGLRYKKLLEKRYTELKTAVLQKMGGKNGAPTAKPKVSATVIGALCKALSEDLIPKPARETIAAYCQGICARVKLPYSDRVRGSFNAPITTDINRKLTKLCPSLPREFSNAVHVHLAKLNKKKALKVA